MADFDEVDAVESDVEYEVTEEDEALFASDFGDSDHSACDKPRIRGKNNNLRVPLVSCHICKRPYFALEAYSKHIRIHLVEDLFSTAPATALVEEHCRTASTNVLEDLKASKITVGLGIEVKKIATDLCLLPEESRWKFVDAVTKGISSCLPRLSRMSLQSFNCKYVKSCNAFLNNSLKCDTLLLMLKQCLTFGCSDAACKWFLSHFFMQLSTQAEAFFLSFIKHPLEIVCVRDGGFIHRDDPDNADFQQTVYYIGGSCVKSIFRKGRRKAGRWIPVIECVKSNLSAGELVNKPSDEIVAWTESVDRGGLQFINEKVWLFLMALSGVLKNVEPPDGSVRHSIPKDQVMMLLWKDVVGDALVEDDSQFLLINLCTFFINAWGKGVEKRHLNALPERSKGKVPLRSSLAK